MKTIKQQIFPIALTIVTFLLLVLLLYVLIHVLNLFPLKEKISSTFVFADIVVGLIIYLKTSIDFALFIGNVMKDHDGTKNRIAIEIGTALGNGIGTFLVLFVWTFFKEVPILMVIMILLSSLVLFRMAEDGLLKINKLAPVLTVVKFINKVFNPLISLILPRTSISSKRNFSFVSLLIFSFSIPFILGLDDFAGYIPLFSVVNVISFATGVFLGHMILNISLFAVPSFTIKIVKMPFVVTVGSLAFLGIGLFGLYEAAKITLGL